MAQAVILAILLNGRVAQVVAVAGKVALHLVSEKFTELHPEQNFL